MVVAAQQRWRTTRCECSDPPRDYARPSVAAMRALIVHTILLPNEKYKRMIVVVDHQVAGT